MIKRILVFIVIVIGLQLSMLFFIKKENVAHWIVTFTTVPLLYQIIKVALRKRNPEGFYLKGVDKGHGDKVIYVLFEYDKSGHRKVIDYMYEQ